MSEKGKKIVLKVKCPEDLNRDIFKSDSAKLSIEELDFEIVPGTLGSFYSTVEGLLEKIIYDLKNNNPFTGDSSDQEQLQKFNEFLN